MKKYPHTIAFIIILLLCTGTANSLSAQEGGPSLSVFDSLAVSGGIPFDSGKLYLQNFFRMPWEPAEMSSASARLHDDSSASNSDGSIMMNPDRSFSINWMNSAAGYSGYEETPFITYSRRSVALGTASAVAIWGTIAAQAWRDRNNLNFYTATAAAALSAYQGAKLWKIVTRKEK